MTKKRSSWASVCPVHRDVRVGSTSITFSLLRGRRTSGRNAMGILLKVKGCFLRRGEGSFRNIAHEALNNPMRCHSGQTFMSSNEWMSLGSLKLSQHSHEIFHFCPKQKFDEINFEFLTRLWHWRVWMKALSIRLARVRNCETIQPPRAWKCAKACFRAIP